jgi:hypothetical protein
MIAPVFIERLCLGVYHRIESKRLFLMLGAYADESGTHEPSPLTIMAGWIATTEDWAALEPRWKALLTYYGVDHAHAKKLYHRERPFKGWSDQRAISFAEQLMVILEAHCRYSLTVILGNKEFESHYRNPDKLERKRRGSVDSKYGVCFRVFLALVTQMIAKFWPEETIHITLEAGHPNSGAAEAIFAEFIQYAPDLANLVTGVSYVAKKKAAGVQAADLLAYPAYGLERHKKAIYQPVNLETMPTLNAAKINNFRAPISVETLADIRSGQIAMAKHRAWMKRIEREAD